MMPTSITRSHLDNNQILQIHTADQSIYPAPLELTTLESWISTCPDLSISYSLPIDGSHDSGTPVAGVVIALPILAKYWNQLLVGALKEWNISPAMFPSDEQEVEVGIHVFHIEKYEAWNKQSASRSFAEFAMSDVAEILAGKTWRVLGYSALVASVAGSRGFKKMNFSSTGYEEMFISRADGGGNIEMLHVLPGQNGADEPLARGDEIVGRSFMLVRYD